MMYEEIDLDDLDVLYDILTEYSIATSDEIDLVTYIIGNNKDSYEKILYVRTGYRSFEQFLEAEGE